MRVRDVMTRTPTVVSPDESLERAAQLMAQLDAGTLPVGENDRLVGMITDRDIAIRAAGEGRNPQTTRVREIMSAGVKYCFEDESVEHVAENMGQIQVRRLPVVNRDKRLVGIVSLGDISRETRTSTSGEALREVSAPAGRYSQRLGRGTFGGRSFGVDSARGPVITAITLIGFTAALMYLFDNTRGPGRRAKLRDQLVRQTQNVRRSAEELAAKAKSKVARQADEESPIAH
jgi:CBS domain-containing protein